jgi:beta-lactam-binding protein with PASTA domain
VRTRTISAVLFCAAAVGTVACQPTEKPEPSGVTSPSVSAGAPSSAPDKDDRIPEKKQVPDFAGMGLQSAQDKAQEQGFFSLQSHDALGRDRMQAFDRNWKVCSQSVAGGETVSTDTRLDFGTVKLEETCPAKDEKPPAAEGDKAPDFTGKSVKAARAALDSGTSITVNDASAEDRLVLVESNWQVCSQTPAAGAALNGQPVEFTAVEFGESCP